MQKKIFTLIVAIYVLFSMCTIMVSAKEIYEPIAKGTYNGHTYQIFDEYMTWKEAEGYCEQMGGHLLTITSESEQSYMEELVGQANRKVYWIGLNFENEANKWSWITGEELGYENWDVGQPDFFESEDYYCGFRNATSETYDITSTKWADFSNQGYIPSDLSDCQKEPSDFGFICEWDYILSSPKNEYDSRNTYNGHTYQAFAEKLTPTDAEKYCIEMGGHLVTITSEKECDFVNKLSEDAEIEGYTIGATDRDEEGTWIWMTGEEWDYTNWNSSIEPNNGLGRGENYCVADAAKNWKWVDYFGEYDNYSSTYPFVCEWDYIRTSFGSEISEWASFEIEEAYDKELIPESLVGEDLTQPITRAEFAAVSVKAYELIANTKALPVVNNPFKDTKDIEVLKAYNTGITIGISATKFAPNALLNREQAATMLTRVFKRATMKEWTIETDAQFELDYKKPTIFDDDNKISAWAKDSVYFMVANKIINGVGGNKFAPQNTTTEEEATGYANATREQALIIATRMVENLK